MRFGELLSRHRRRIAAVVAVSGVLVVALALQRALPRRVTLRLDLGPGHGGVSGLDVTLAQDGETLRAARFGFGGGGGVGSEEAPRLVQHEVWLTPGRYTLFAVVRGSGRAREHTRTVVVSEGASDELRIELFDIAFAAAEHPPPQLTLAPL